jgi:HSP20 family protein
MPGLIIWKNQEIDKLRRDMDRLFARLWDDFGMPHFTRPSRDIPFIDLSETEADLILKAEVPGLKPEDLDISITDDILTIKGEMNLDLVRESENYHRMERRYESFSRSLQLPCRVIIEDVEATYKEGILTIIMPKCKPEISQRVKIKIK